MIERAEVINFFPEVIQVRRYFEHCERGISALQLCWPRDHKPADAQKITAHSSSPKSPVSAATAKYRDIKENVSSLYPTTGIILRGHPI